MVTSHGIGYGQGVVGFIVLGKELAHQLETKRRGVEITILHETAAPLLQKRALLELGVCFELIHALCGRAQLHPA